MVAKGQATSSPIRVEMTAQSQQTIAKLAHLDAMPELRRNMREATGKVVPDLRKEAKGTPSQVKRADRRGGSLRAAVASSMKRVLKLGKRETVVLILNKPHGGKSNLGRVLEGELDWHHPTYGHDPEVNQRSYPFFWRTIDKHTPEMDRKISQVLNDIERKL